MLSQFSIPRWRVPDEFKSWVLDEGSLTQRLKQASAGDFRVRVVFSGWGKPTLNEVKSLETGTKQRLSGVCLVREVELMCLGEVWVRARSIIPASTLSGAERQLKVLGSKPLGEFLFRARSMRRSRLEPFCQRHNSGALYGRRSVFYLHEKPLLVSELFLPQVLQANAKGSMDE